MIFPCLEAVFSEGSFPPSLPRGSFHPCPRGCASPSLEDVLFFLPGCYFPSSRLCFTLLGGSASPGLIFLFLPGGCPHSYLNFLLLTIWRHFPPCLETLFLPASSFSPYLEAFLLPTWSWFPTCRLFSLPRGNFSHSLEPVFLPTYRMFSSQPGGCFHPNPEAIFLFGGCFPTCQQFLSIAGRSFPPFLEAVSLSTPEFTVDTIPFTH